jgi:predicted nucleic acid-binding protein
LGIDRLDSFLRRKAKLALDTSVFVYHLEAHPKYIPLTRAIFAWLEASGHRGITSMITMTELLVKPYRDRDERLVDNCFALFSKFPNLDWVAPNLDISDAAARFRAECRLKTPDAIQVATAVWAGVQGLITNDTAFRRVSEVETLVLDEVL